MRTGYEQSKENASEISRCTNERELARSQASYEIDVPRYIWDRLSDLIERLPG